VTTIDGRETAPAAMTPTSFWENGTPLPFNDARFSGMSVGVPGTVATWVDALDEYGTMRLADVLQPGIHVASHGYLIDQTWFDQANAVRDWFDDVPATAALFLDPDGTPHDVGTVFTNPDLAATYERIAHLGLKGFYRGAIADALVDAVDHPPVSPTANHLLLSRTGNLCGWSMSWRCWSNMGYSSNRHVARFQTLPNWWRVNRLQAVGGATPRATRSSA
jgi:gamma-glutamyltranspeptidase/glutathione hydrolase